MRRARKAQDKTFPAALALAAPLGRIEKRVQPASGLSEFLGQVPQRCKAACFSWVTLQPRVIIDGRTTDIPTRRGVYSSTDSIITEVVSDRIGYMWVFRHLGLREAHKERFEGGEWNGCCVKNNFEHSPERQVRRLDSTSGVALVK